MKAGTLAQFIRENVSEDVDVIITDDFASYPYAMERAGMTANKHKTINHSSKVYVMGDIHTNTVEIRLLASQARHYGNVASSQRKASRGLSRRNELPVQSPEKLRFVLGYPASYGYGCNFDFQKIDRLNASGVGVDACSSKLLFAASRSAQN